MEEKHYYHLFANGDDAKNFITSEFEFKAAFNRFGVCASHTDVEVVSFSIVQATKDGKAVMPYDYRYGTGALYFRSKYTILPWLIDDSGEL